MTVAPGEPLSLASSLGIDRAVRHWAGVKPDDEFLLWFEGPAGELALDRLTWCEFAVAVDATVSFLAGHGVEPGDSVCWQAQNAPEAALLLAACAAAGWRFVPANWRLTANELHFILRDCGARVVVADEGRLTVAGQAADGPALVLQAALRAAWREAIRGGCTPGPARTTSAALDDRAILYTSGTTSTPKGVRISEAALLHAGHHISGFTGVTAADRSLAVLPMCHVNGLCYNLMVAFARGASVCVVDRFSSSHYWRQAARAHTTISWMAGTPMRMLLARPEEAADRAHEMRLIIYGQNLSDEGFRAWRRRFGTDLIQIYGSTETVTLPLNNRTTSGERSDAAVGVPSPGVLARLSSDAITTPDGTRVGELELYLRPVHHMMSGYLNQDAATAARFTADGWFMTGDTMELREDGLLYFLDRNSDIIKVKGENVSATEVEKALESCSAVREAAVVGVPDELTDHAIRAYVVPSEGDLDADAVRRMLSAVLADFKLPKEFVSVSSLPRTNTGKVQKKLLLQGTTSTHPWE